MFDLGAGIFEHVGVFITHTYSYDQHRLMMAGAISLATLLIEAAIVYSSTVLLNISTRNSGCQFGALVFYLSFKIFRSTPFMFMIPTSFTEF